jgi:Gpi18-like mannosyltransferase
MAKRMNPEISPPLANSPDPIERAPLNEQAPAPRSEMPRGGQGSALRFFWVYAIVLGSLLLRVSLLDFESLDYRMYLSPWYDHLAQQGPWSGLKDDFSNYAPLYHYFLAVATLLPIPKLYAIKLISILFDYLAAWFVFRIVRCRLETGPMPWLGAALVLFLPTVWFNSALWGQCDAMYTTALLAGFYYCLAKRQVAAMVAFGFACALKPQAIFLVPFLGGMILRERFRWRYLAIAPLVYAACGLPAMLAGKPVLDVLLHWVKQKNIPGLTLNAANWYQWLPNDYLFYNVGIVLAIVGTVFLVLAMQAPGSMDRFTALATAAFLSVLMVPYFLPGMHERYFFAADLFAVVLAFGVARGWIAVVLLQFCSLFSYWPFLFQREPVPLFVLSLILTAVLMVVARHYALGVLGRRAAAPDET